MRPFRASPPPSILEVHQGSDPLGGEELRRAQGEAAAVRPQSHKHRADVHNPGSSPVTDTLLDVHGAGGRTELDLPLGPVCQLFCQLPNPPLDLVQVTGALPGCIGSGPVSRACLFKGLPCPRSHLKMEAKKAVSFSMDRSWFWS